MSQQKPKIQFPTNIPVTVRIGEQFWSGEGQYGMSYGWNMTESGVEKSCFVKPYLNDKIKGYPRGTELVITKKEVADQGGRPRTEWVVMPAGIQPPSGVTPQAPVVAQNGHSKPLAQEVWDREGYRAERILRAEEAIIDSMRALKTDQVDENVRALAISFLIDEQRKNVPAPDDGADF